MLVGAGLPGSNAWGPVVIPCQVLGHDTEQLTLLLQIGYVKFSVGKSRVRVRCITASLCLISGLSPCVWCMCGSYLMYFRSVSHVCGVMAFFTYIAVTH